MAQIIFPQQKKQKKMLLILPAVVLIAVLVLYFGLRNPSVKTEPLVSEPGMIMDEEGLGMLPGEAGAAVPQTRSATTLTPLIKGIKIDFDFFKSEKFISLKIFGSIPPRVDQKGRANPFLPY